MTTTYPPQFTVNKPPEPGTTVRTSAFIDGAGSAYHAYAYVERTRVTVYLSALVYPTPDEARWAADEWAAKKNLKAVGDFNVYS